MQNHEPIRQIVIVGGGTAGWMTAAAMVRFLGRGGCRITLVESEAIGTVGVGEGTIPPILEFNQMLGIPERKFLQETKASYKLGVDFVGWRSEGERYFHQFGHIGRHLEGIGFHHLWLKHRHDPSVGPLSAYSMSAVAAANGRFAHPAPDPRSPLSTPASTAPSSAATPRPAGPSGSKAGSSMSSATAATAMSRRSNWKTGAGSKDSSSSIAPASAACSWARPWA